MVDMFTREKRSEIMSKVRSKDTTLELKVRREIWRRGKRYRVHSNKVFGTPDLCNKSKKVAVFIDGCFWHGCPRCYAEPSSNVPFWRKKVQKNKVRREVVRKELKEKGWLALEFWACEINKDFEKVVDKICERL